MRTAWRSTSAGVAAGVVAVAAVLLAQSPVAQWRPQQSGVTVRLRGVSAVSDRVAWASGAQGTVLRTTDGGATWQRRPVPEAAGALDFRDVDAVSAEIASILSIGPGAASRIYKTRDGGATWTLQLANTDPKVFLDAMAFRDERHGVAFSDSVDGQFVVFTTSDGATWTRVPADRLPPALPGEGAFAASGSNVALGAGGRLWIGTTKGRVLRSTDDGRTWSVVQTPVATGEATGIFSIAFRDQQHGVVVGGNYQQETLADRNVATTSDGGATWQAVAEGAAVTGFRSAVAWWPGARAGWIAVGPSGSDWSADGRTWTPAGGDGYDAFSVAPGGAMGWASGAGGRLAAVALAR